MQGQLRVLYLTVGDEESAPLARVLRDGGYVPEFTPAGDAEQMRAALASGEYDVVLSAYMAGAFNPESIRNILQEVGLDPPLIIVADEIGAEAGVAALKAGAHDFVLKENLGRLAVVVKRELEAAHRRREHGLAETARRNFETNLRQSQKMEALGQLAGGVAHDFNNLLTAILGNAELMQAELQGELGEEDPLIAALEQIDQAGQRAAGLTRQLLMFSRREITRAEVIDPNEMLREMMPMLRRLIIEDITLDLQLAPETVSVRADSGGLEQLVMNLVVNARDAMPSGGKLLIKTDCVVLDDAYVVEHPEAQPGSHVILTVADTGCGMPPETVERIFEPFFTTKGAGKGTGLGLATAHGIAKQAGGHIRVESTPGRGTTFSIYLPATGGSVTAAGEVGEVSRAGGNECLLVCEDDPLTREAICRVLRQRGYTVLAAEHGEAALRLAEQHTGPIHLLLADAVMPDMNGWALSQAMSAKHPETKSLFMSGYPLDVLMSHGFPQHDIAMEQKPFSLNAMALRVRGILDEGKGEDDGA